MCTPICCGERTIWARTGSPSEVVSEEEGRQLASQIKARPLPRNREIVPLRFWRWKLQGAEEDEWVASDFDDSLWNELEVPTVLDMGRAMLLRCTAHIRASERVVLDIESIHDEYELWVNGESVAHHEGYEPHQRRHHVVRRSGEDRRILLQSGSPRSPAIRSVSPAASRWWAPARST